MTATIDQLWAAVEDSPTDDTLKLVLADSYADADDGGTDPTVLHDREVADVIRLLVAQRRWPRQTYSSLWQWSWGKTGAIPKKPTAVLPPPWFRECERTERFNDYIEKAGGVRVHYERDYSCRGRVLLLAATLVRLRNQLPPNWWRP